MKYFVTVLSLALALGTTAASASEADLQKQIDDLKAQITNLHRPAAEAGHEGETSTFGGYGEITYNHYSKDTERSQVDLRRFVLFFGHRFNEQIGFFSEVEWEHAITSKDDQGESEIEQAYLDYTVCPDLKAKIGLFLMPFGFLNEAHEPPVFYGVDRNEVETRIIPSTWREGGLGFSGQTAVGLSWDFGITTGFDVAKFDEPGSPLAGMHQELQMAKAHDPSFYGALNYRGLPGVTVGGALFTGNSAQGNADFKADSTLPDFGGVTARVTLWDLHARFNQHGLDLMALYAQGRIGNSEQIDQTIDAFNTANPTATRRELVPSEFYGWLVQGAYVVWSRNDKSLAPFVRFEQYNTQAKMPAGFANDPANADRVMTAGLSFKPHPSVVFKADYRDYADNSAGDRFNLGMGYMF